MIKKVLISLGYYLPIVWWNSHARPPPCMKSQGAICQDVSTKPSAPRDKSPWDGTSPDLLRAQGDALVATLPLLPGPIFRQNQGKSCHRPSLSNFLPERCPTV